MVNHLQQRVQCPHNIRIVFARILCHFKSKLEMFCDTLASAVDFIENENNYFLVVRGMACVDITDWALPMVIGTGVLLIRHRESAAKLEKTSCAPIEFNKYSIAFKPFTAIESKRFARQYEPSLLVQCPQFTWLVINFEFNEFCREANWLGTNETTFVRRRWNRCHDEYVEHQKVEIWAVVLVLAHKSNEWW